MENNIVRAKYENYRERYIVFFDLQGFSSTVDCIGDSENGFNRVADIVYGLKLLEDKSGKRKIYRAFGLSSEDQKSMIDDLEITVLSDSVLVSFPVLNSGLNIIAMELAMIQWYFLWKLKVLLRGVMHKGLLYHKDRVVFGSGFQKAYHMCEGKDAHWQPCILIRKELVGVKSLFWSEFGPDHLFLNFPILVDHSSFDSSVGADRFQQAAQAFAFLWFENWPKSDKVKSKYEWTQHRMIEASDLFAELYYKNILIEMLRRREVNLSARVE